MFPNHETSVFIFVDLFLRPGLMILDRLPLAPLGDCPGVDPEFLA